MSSAVLSLSYDLGPRIVVIEPGPIPEDQTTPPALVLQESLTILSRHGDRTGTILALETGLESGTALRDYLARFDTGSLGVNFDPANLMQQNIDVYTSLRALTGKIVHAHGATSAPPATASLAKSPSATAPSTG